jgi:hypothetical protein
VRLALLVVLASGCAELRKGWVKVDFVSGGPSPEMVCKMTVDGDDLTAVCVPVEVHK